MQGEQRSAHIHPPSIEQPSGDQVGGASQSAPLIRWWRDPVTAPLLDRWAQAVGPPAVAPATDQLGNNRPVDQQAVDTLHIVTWNTNVGGGDLCHLIERLHAAQFSRTQRPQHVVLLLQEVYRSGAHVPTTPPLNIPIPRRIYNHPPSNERLDILDIARRTGLNVYYVPSMRNGQVREDRGNAIVSTLPLTELQAIELPFEAQRRVAVAATVCGTAASGALWRLRVASVHFDVWSRQGIRASLGEGRLRQAQALVHALGNTAPVIVGGDLNTWGTNEAALPYLHRYFDGVHLIKRQATHKHGRCLDHLLFRLPARWHASHERLAQRFGSDHYPLLGQVHVR